MGAKNKIHVYNSHGTPEWMGVFAELIKIKEIVEIAPHATAFWVLEGFRDHCKEGVWGTLKGQY